jgi:hypothetical protein
MFGLKLYVLDIDFYFKKHDLLWKTWGHGSLKVKVSGNWWNSYPLALIYLSGRNSMICKETINPRV